MTDHGLKIRIKTTKFVALKDENHVVYFFVTFQQAVYF
jgi:hypothetical protein